MQAVNGHMPPPWWHEVVILSAVQFKEGTFRILETDFIKRRCIMEINAKDVTFLFKVECLLDEPASALQQQ